MRKKQSGEEGSEPKRQPAIEYLSLSSISQKTALKTLQHPAVLIPLAICILLVTYLLLLSVIFGGKLGAIILAVIAATLAAFSFYYRYSKDYPEMIREHLESLRAEQVQMEDTELSQLRQTLENGFTSIPPIKGMKALNALTGEYEQLKNSLSQPRSTDSLSMPLIGSLAGETYRQGLAVLSDALELMIAAPSSERERLGKDITELGKNIETAVKDGRLDERLEIMKETLNSHRRRFHLLDQIEINIDRLIHEAGRCEFALNTARMELASVRASSLKTNVDNVTESLQGTIHRVKEVQDELSKIGY